MLHAAAGLALQEATNSLIKRMLSYSCPKIMSTLQDQSTLLQSVLLNAVAAYAVNWKE